MNSERPDNDDTTAADAASGTSEGVGADTSRGTDEAGAGRPARRRSAAVAAASVAAAVLLVGGGGAYLATTASDGPDGGTASGAPGDGAPPPLALDGYAAPSQDGTNGIAPGEPNPYGVTYRAGGPLPEGPGSAPVYGTKGEVTEEEVARLAEALGVEGAPVAQGEDWRVGNAEDGSGPLLRVDRQAPGTWTFQRYTPGTDDCGKGSACKIPSAGGTPVGEEAARKAAAPVLKAVGQDDAKVDASQVMGAQRAVNAEPEVGGLPTHGWTTGVTVGAQGDVVGGSGLLKTPVKGATYPVLDAERTLGLMNAPGSDPRAGIGGCASPVPHQDRADEARCAPSGPGGTPKKETIEVERAVFGLAAHPVQGRQTLVPSWLFEVRAPGAEDAFTVTYPAVQPKFLTSTAPRSPSDEPTSAPARPRDVPVSGYTAEGTELTVYFTGGVCSDYAATAAEGADEVTVTVTETPHPDKVCILIAKEYQQTVRLDEPLGDRQVVGSDGKGIPSHKPGARLPAPSGNR
ncbi:membrane protein [Streptomyces viridiviolaceus]|uniref:Large membrane protein n=1 Tax=Streptomyces viridiviolaceus TaxID=68282 RepID=A0ABW2E8S0_9ACTN|nr:hypothetical protein [Streptomyces viridiviolaceus]GHB59844.1 membrane protein [Streptomyces viridiviolaceus]